MCDLCENVGHVSGIGVFAAAPPIAADFTTSGTRWTDNGGTGSGSTTSALGATGGVIAWSVAGAGLSNVTGVGFYTGTSVDMATFLPFDYVAVLRQVFDAWAAAANVEFIQVADQGGNIGAGAYPTIRIVGGFIDGQSGSNVLARAFYPSSNVAGGDIVFDNGNTSFYSSSNNFYLTALHEVGHALGLGHETVNTAIMAPTINTSLFGTGPLGNGLQQDDINGIRAVYGAQDFGANAYFLPSTTANMTLIDDAPGNTINGNASANIITGNGAANSLRGLGGNDTLNGGDGDDTLEGGTGADALNGGNGSDTSSYAGSAAGVMADLLTGASAGGDAAGDTFSSVENLVGSALNDTLLGNGSANTLSGGNGGDFLFGRFGADVLRGGEGDDTIFGDDASGFPDGTPGIAYGADQLFGEGGNDNLYGEGGADIISGGAGTDLVNYSTSPFGITVDLVNRQGFGPTGSYASGDTYALDAATGRSDVENVRGSNFDDILIGNTGANTLEGMGGNDTLIGSIGADILSGGAGRDTFTISSVAEGGDIVADFSVADSEVIDLRTLFAAHGLSTANPIGQGILKIEGLGGGTTHTTINIDLDGAAGPAAAFTLYTLVNVNPASIVAGTHVRWV